MYKNSDSDSEEAQMNAKLHGLVFLVTTLLCGLIGSTVGFVWGLSCGPREAGAALWALCWTSIGGLQGASVAAAWHLGQRRRGTLVLPAVLTISAASFFTTVLTTLLWLAVSEPARLSLYLAEGLSYLCFLPPMAYLIARRAPAPSLPAQV